MIGGQLLIIFVGSTPFSITPINGIQWAICILIAMLSFPVGVIIRFIPDGLVAKFWTRISPIFSLIARSWRAFERSYISPILSLFSQCWRILKGVFPWAKKPAGKAERELEDSQPNADNDLVVAEAPEIVVGEDGTEMMRPYSISRFYYEDDLESRLAVP